MTDLPELMTVDELASYLRVPKATLYGWRASKEKEGGPPAIRIGRHLRYRRSDVLAWLDSRKG